MTYIGLQYTTALNALILQSATPMIILLWALVLFGERPGLRQMLGMMLSLRQHGRSNTNNCRASIHALRLRSAHAAWCACQPVSRPSWWAALTTARAKAPAPLVDEANPKCSKLFPQKQVTNSLCSHELSR
jgi:hypothetical protein